MEVAKTSPAIVLRFSTDIMWINFIERICSKCNKDICSHKEAQHCFDDWLLEC